MIYLVAFVVLVLATARLTRLIHFDDITIRLRLWIDTRFGSESFMSKMVYCPWCASVWAAMFTSALAVGIFNRLHADNPPWDVQVAVLLLLILALSYPAGWIVHRETIATSRGE